MRSNWRPANGCGIGCGLDRAQLDRRAAAEHDRRGDRQRRLGEVRHLERRIRPVRRRAVGLDQRAGGCCSVPGAASNAIRFAAQRAVEVDVAVLAAGADRRRRASAAPSLGVHATVTRGCAVGPGSGAGPEIAGDRHVRRVDELSTAPSRSRAAPRSGRGLLSRRVHVRQSTARSSPVRARTSTPGRFTLTAILWNLPSAGFFADA